MDVPLPDVGTVAAGDAHACAATAFGSGGATVWCWGSNRGGALGRPEPGSYAAREVFRADLFELASGRDFGCLTEAGQSTLCWGDGRRGALGQETSEPLGRVHSVPGLFAVVGPLSLGPSHGCVGSGLGVHCWGRNDSGQASPDLTEDPVPATPLGVQTYFSLALGERHSCAIDGETSAVLCWGASSSGELGDGTTIDRRAPGPVVGLPSAPPTAIVAADATTCALLEGGEVWCWGDGAHGQLGTEAGAFSSVPLRVVDLPPVDRLVAGARSFCAHAGTEVFCWGQNLHGELGLGGTSARELPTRAPMLDRFSRLSLGDGFGCGVADGFAWCWGDNALGQVNGHADEPPIALEPLVVGLHRAE